MTLSPEQAVRKRRSESEDELKQHIEALYEET